MTTNFGGVDVVPLLGAIVVCYRCGGRVTTNFGEWTCHLLGAIAGCHCSVLWWGDGVAGRHCSLLWFGGRVTTNFGGVDVVPLLGAIAGCHCSVLVEGKAKVNFGGGAIAGAIVVCYGWGGG